MQRLLFALALTATAPAWAEQAEAPTTANGQSLIEAAAAQDLFEVLPATEHAIVVRHSRSGLVCRMDPGNENRIVVFPQAARGEDVACDSADARESMTLYATRYSFETTLQEQIDGADAAIRHRFPDARPYSGVGTLASDGSQPASRTIEFLVSRSDGARMYTRASVALVNGWAIKLRYTVVAPDDAAALEGHGVSDAAWRAALAELGASP